MRSAFALTVKIVSAEAVIISIQYSVLFQTYPSPDMPYRPHFIAKLYDRRAPNAKPRPRIKEFEDPGQMPPKTQNWRAPALLDVAQLFVNLLMLLPNGF